MAYSGLRPQVLGNRRGRNGLQVRDLPEMVIDGGEVSFKKIPTRVFVGSSLSKAKHRYFTFPSSEGCEYLRAYLEMRLSQGEALDKRTAVIAVKPGYEDFGVGEAERTSKHITTKSITKEIRDAMRPRFRFRPYVLRAYFDTQLMFFA
jgi:hypothetical protein